MYPKDKKTAALMSETIREVLTNEELFKHIVENSDEVPKYFDLLPKQNGITAMSTALMIKAMGGDVAAFTALSKFGFGEKVKMEVSDFYRTDKIDIQVVDPVALDDENSPEQVGKEVHEALTKNVTEGQIVDGSTEDSGIEEGSEPVGKEDQEGSES